MANWALLLGLWIPAPVDVDAELQRFPPRDVVIACRSFNRAYHRHLAEAQSLFPGRPDLAEALHENQLVYHVWDTLDDAQCYSDPYCRVNALRRLRELLGDEVYFRGRMPPPVPVWRFKELD